MNELNFKKKFFDYNFLIKISKIVVIVFFSFMLLGNFFPYFDGAPDSYYYAVHAKRLSQGNWSLENEFIENSSGSGFIPKGYEKTIHGSAIPAKAIQPGLPALGSIFYLIGGEFGLFYLGPIFSILFLIISERIATKYFGSFIGFLTVLFLGTNEFIFYIGQNLLTENVFSVLFLTGIFFLLKFIEDKKISNIFLASSFFALTSLLRFNGFVLFPIEMFSVIFLAVFNSRNLPKLFENKITTNTRTELNRIKNFRKILLYMLIPWILVFSFFFVYNEYYFGDPFEIYVEKYNRMNIPDQNNNDIISKELIKDNNVFKYSNALLPYPIYRIGELSIENSKVSDAGFPLIGEGLKISNNFFEESGKYSLGIFSLFIIGFSLVIAYYKKQKMLEISLFSFFILGFVISYSLIISEEYGTGRFILPVFPLFSVILGYQISFLIKNGIFKNQMSQNFSFYKIFRITMIIIVIIFFIIAWYSSEPTQIIKQNGVRFNDPYVLAENYVIDRNEISEKNIIVSTFTPLALEYSDVPYAPFYQYNIRFLGEKLEDREKDVKEDLLFAMKKGYDVYVFKKIENKQENEILFINNLTSNKTNLVLVENSENFCKIILNKNNSMNTMNCDS